MYYNNDNFQSLFVKIKIKDKALGETHKKRYIKKDITFMRR